MNTSLARLTPGLISAAAALCLAMCAYPAMGENSEDAALGNIVMISGRTAPSLPPEVRGAGIIVGATRHRVYVATALHVLQGQGDADLIEPMVEFRDLPGEPLNGIINAKRDAQSDLGVIAINRRDYDYVAFDEEPPAAHEDEVPDSLFIVGYGDQVPWSRNRRPAPLIDVLGDELTLPTDDVQPGHSGGGVFDVNWRLVGMVTSVDDEFAYANKLSHVVALLSNWNIPVFETLRAPETGGAPPSLVRAHPRPSNVSITPLGKTQAQRLGVFLSGPDSGVVRNVGVRAFLEMGDGSLLDVGGVGGLVVDHMQDIQISSPSTADIVHICVTQTVAELEGTVLSVTRLSHNASSQMSSYSTVDVREAWFSKDEQPCREAFDGRRVISIDAQTARMLADARALSDVAYATPPSGRLHFYRNSLRLNVGIEHPIHLYAQGKVRQRVDGVRVAILGGLTEESASLRHVSEEPFSVSILESRTIPIADMPQTVIVCVLTESGVGDRTIVSEHIYRSANDTRQHARNYYELFESSPVRFATPGDRCISGAPTSVAEQPARTDAPTQVVAEVDPIEAAIREGTGGRFDPAESAAAIAAAKSGQLKPHGPALIGLRLGMSMAEADRVIRASMDVARVLEADRSLQFASVTGNAKPYSSGRLYISEGDKVAVGIFNEPPAATGTLVAAWYRAIVPDPGVTPAALFKALRDRLGPQTDALESPTRIIWADGRRQQCGVFFVRDQIDIWFDGEEPATWPSSRNGRGIYVPAFADMRRSPHCGLTLSTMLLREHTGANFYGMLSNPKWYHEIYSASRNGKVLSGADSGDRSTAAPKTPFTASSARSETQERVSGTAPAATSEQPDEIEPAARSSAPVSGDPPAAAPKTATTRTVKLQRQINEAYWVRKASNVRALPTTRSSVVAKLRANQRVDVVGLVEGRRSGYEWYEVSLADGTRAYVATVLLSANPPAAPVQRKKSRETAPTRKPEPAAKQADPNPTQKSDPVGDALGDVIRKLPGLFQ